MISLLAAVFMLSAGALAAETNTTFDHCILLFGNCDGYSGNLQAYCVSPKASQVLLDVGNATGGAFGWYAAAYNYDRKVYYFGGLVCVYGCVGVFLCRHAVRRLRQHVSPTRHCTTRGSLTFTSRLLISRLHRCRSLVAG
jgi:hypothetical protein